MNISENTFSFSIHSFILNMPLTLCEKFVYALLYSYTMGEHGMYFGTRERLSEQLGLSIRSVARAYKTLLALGYIEKVTRSGKVGVRCVQNEGDKPLPTVKKSARSEMADDMQSAKGGSGQPEAAQKSTQVRSAPKSEECTANNINEDSQTVIPKTNYLRNTAKPKFEIMEFGKEGFIQLTPEQYSELRKLVDCEVLQCYFSKMEKMLWEGRLNTIPGPHSHYRTLKKWIISDLGV